MNKKKKTAAVSESLVPTPQRLISNVTVEILNNKVDFLSNTNQPNSANTDESMPNFENEGPATTSTDAAVMTNMALLSSNPFISTVLQYIMLNFRTQNRILCYMN